MKVNKVVHHNLLSVPKSTKMLMLDLGSSRNVFDLLAFTLSDRDPDNPFCLTMQFVVLFPV